MSNDLDVRLRQLGGGNADRIDESFVYRLDQRVGIEALVARERAAARKATEHSLLTATAIFLPGAMLAWLIPGAGPAVAAVIAILLCCWMLLTDWSLPAISLVQDEKGE